MTLRRALGIGWWVAVVTFPVSACGGTVSGRESARDQLESGGADLCEAACRVIADCGDAPATSDCSCGCPVGAEVCPPCDCGTSTETPGDCAAECGESVEEVLRANAGCEAKMLAVIGCVRGSAACDFEERCVAEQRALEDCRDAGDDIGDRPPVGTQVGPGVTCSAGFTSLSPSGGPPGVGAQVCHRGWDECSDGNRYEVRCLLRADGALDCECVLSGSVVNAYVSDACRNDTADANAACGWTL